MQNNQLIVDDGIINSLEVTLQREQELLDVKKSILGELERSQEEYRLARIEQLLAFLHQTSKEKGKNHQIDSQKVHRLNKDKIDEFIAWETGPTIEALNFLLSEFFTNSFPGKEWDKMFIGELVFEVMRVVNFINTLEKKD